MPIKSNSYISERIINKIIINYKNEDLDNIKRCLIEMKKRNKNLNENFTNLISEHFKLKSVDELYIIENKEDKIIIKQYLLKTFVKETRIILFISYFLTTFIFSIIFEITNKLLKIDYRFFILDFIILALLAEGLSEKYINRFTGYQFGFILVSLNFILVLIISIALLFLGLVPTRSF
jgi:hypothetical protein